MTPEEAQAFSEGEFRGEVLTKLESIQGELSEHKEDHRKYYNGKGRVKATVVPVVSLSAGLAIMGLVWMVLEKV